MFKKIMTAAVAALCCIAPTSCEKSAESSDVSASVEIPESGVGDVVEPETGSDEFNLGNYRMSHSGVKLYYDDTVVPTDLMLTLEKYFTSYEKHDFETYKTCVFPGYTERMDTYLQSEYQYDINTSFEKQCENIKDMAGNEYTITRIRAVPAEEGDPEKFFSYLNDIFETDYYKEVQENSENLHDLMFYVMAEVNGEEVLIIEDYEIVFAEKDGAFYTFG